METYYNSIVELISSNGGSPEASMVYGSNILIVSETGEAMIAHYYEQHNKFHLGHITEFNTRQEALAKFNDLIIKDKK